MTDLKRNSIAVSDSHIVISADEETELMIRRLIPSHDRWPLRVSAHAENAKIIRMIMSEYPLEITTKPEWENLQAEIKKDEILAESLRTLQPANPGQNFIGTLRPFQEIGLDFLLKTNGIALIADEMGLGKTIQTLAYVARTTCAPVVVIAPLVTLENWRREITKFLELDTPTMFGDTIRGKPRVVVVRSGKGALPPAEFYVVNYEMVSRRVKSLTAINPKLIVYDEVQHLRNDTTIKYAACTALGKHPTVKHRIGLSGTPIYNRGIEMYRIAEAIKPGSMGDRGEFVRRYCSTWNDAETDRGSGKRDALSSRLKKTIMIRRKKVDVLDDLPEKNKIQQEIPIDSSAYRSQLRDMYSRVEAAKRRLENIGSDDAKKEGLFELNKTIREMRVAERQIAGLAKAPHVVEYIKNLLDDYEDEKFVVFCHHRAVHAAIKDGLFMYNPMQVIGGQSDKERQLSIDKFQGGNSRVIICGLRAGNVGINLTSAAYVIFAELDWSPSIHKQAEDRLHRIGQKKTVFSHYLVGEGTFDEQIVPTLVDKTVEIADALGDKLETIDNEKAMKLLAEKFQVSGVDASIITGENEG